MQAVKVRPHGGKYHTKGTRRDRPKVYAYAEMQQLQALTLHDKEAWAKKVIEKALRTLKNPSLAFSGGKDSTVLLHLLQPYIPQAPVILGNTTIEFPESLRFARKLASDWDLNYYEAKPDVNFWWVVKEYGWPLMGKTYGVGGIAHKSSRELFFADLEKEGKLTKQYAIQAEVPISSACCTFLKERPSIRKQKELGVDGVFLGILASESRQRMFNFLNYGEWYKPKTQPVWKCHPLAIWSDDDIWAYIKKYDVPYSSLYDMGYYDDFGEWICHKRNGCMFCGMDIKFKHNHLSIMRRTHPQAWNVVMKKKGMGNVLLALRFAIDNHQMDMFTHHANIETYLERFPCAFDRI